MSRKTHRQDAWRAHEEMAAALANDIAEGIDNGESRRKLRQAVTYFAMKAHYEQQARLLVESRLKVMTLGLELMQSVVVR